MLKFFKKPQIKTIFIKRTQQVKVIFTNADAETAFIMILMTIKQVAKYLKMDTRALIYKINELDKKFNKVKKNK